MKDRNLAIKKVKAYVTNPDLIKEPSMGEMADLVVIVLTAVQQIEEAIKAGRLDGRTPEADNDYLAKETALTIINQSLSDVINQSNSVLNQTSAEMESRVQKALDNIRDGDDGIVGEEEIKRAASIALEMLELPDFEALVTEAITVNGEAIRDALELLTGDNRYKVEISDVTGLEKILKDLAQIRATNGGGGLGKTQVYEFIRQAIADGTITTGGASTFLALTDTPAAYTGQAGKFPKVNAGETALEFVAIPGGGDMLAANNLSDLANAVTARTNLGLGSAATQASTAFAAALGVDDNYVTDAEKAALHGVNDANTTSNAYADAKVADAINNGTTTIAPSQNAVFDALALKAPLDSPVFTTAVTLPVALTGVIRADLGVVSVDTDVTDIVAAASDTAAGKVERDTDAEFTTGSDTTRYVTAAQVASVAQTQTNKRKQPRVYTIANNASLTPEIDTYDIFHLTAMSAATTINNHSTSTPANGEKIQIRFLDNGTARALTWGTAYVAKAGIALPTTTVLSKNLMVGFEYNANLAKWNLIASALEA